ncbi:MAG TPA: hypothetical protein VEU47_14195 [Candidatus Cybelea sp.]|nr:hypothetical protein [Candidatus Cybelea sp.]
MLKRTSKFAAMLLAGLALGYVAASAHAAAGNADPRTAALQGALTGTPDGLASLDAWLGEPSALPALTAARAGSLIGDLRRLLRQGNTTVVQAAAERISRAALSGMRELRVARAAVPSNIHLGDGRFGFAFQPPGAQAPQQFTAISPGDPRIAGRNLKAVRSTNDQHVLRSGIVGIESVKLAMPSGNWRVLVLTSDDGPLSNAEPFGREVRVNNDTFQLASSRPNQWLQGATIGDGAAGGSPSGGVLMLPGRVSNATLTIAFSGGDSPTYVCAIIVEPADKPSLLRSGRDLQALLDPRTDTSAIAEAVAAIDDAIGALLADIPTAAGPGAGPDQLAQQLGLNNPPSPQQPAVSPN